MQNSEKHQFSAPKITEPQAEGRKYSSGDFGPGGAGMGQHDMVMRRSTDSGRSFARLATLVDAVDFAPWKGQSPETANDRGNAV